MPKPTLLSGGPPTKGLALKVNPYLGSPGLLECEGFHFAEAGALTKWQGLAKFNTTRLDEASFGPASMLGLVEFTKSDGTSQILVATSHGLYRFDNGVFVAIPMPDGLVWTMFPNEVPGFVVLGDQLYICNGFTPNLRYDGQTLYRMGITPPPTAPSASIDGSGVLTGAYKYRVTFYNADTGQESNPSPVSNTLTLSSQRVLLSQLPISADPQVTARRIYRTTANGEVLLFLAQIDDNLTTTFADNNGDGQLDFAIEEFRNSVPPIFGMMALYRGHIFGVPRRSSRVHFSASPLNPAGFDSNDFRDLDPNDGFTITAIHRLYDTVVVFKGNSIWNGAGENRASFGFLRQVNGVGTTNQQAVVAIPGKTKLLFPFRNGIYSYDGVGETYESSEIEPIWHSLKRGHLTLGAGVVYSRRNMAIWFLPRATNPELTNDLALIYDYVGDQWMTRDQAGFRIQSAASVIDPVSGEEILLVGGYVGFVRQFDTGLSDDGVSIRAVVVDRPHPKDTDLTDDDEDKVFFALSVLFKPQAGSQLVVSAQVDEYAPQGLWTPLGTLDLSGASGRAELRFRLYGQRLYLKLDGSGLNRPVVLRDWRVRYKRLGRRR